MAAFPFNDLPKELRLLIWEKALLTQSTVRFVVFGTQSDRIIPLNSLASPFLRVNTESRSCAINFFDTKLTVYGLRDSNKAIYLAYWDSYKGIVSKGSMYLSSRHDIFIANLDLNLPCLGCSRYFASCGLGIYYRIRRILSISAHRHEIRAPHPALFHSMSRIPEFNANLYWLSSVFTGAQEYFFVPKDPLSFSMSHEGDILQCLIPHKPGGFSRKLFDLKEMVWIIWHDLECGYDFFRKKRCPDRRYLIDATYGGYNWKSDPNYPYIYLLHGEIFFVTSLHRRLKELTGLELPSWYAAPGTILFSR